MRICLVSFIILLTSSHYFSQALKPHLLDLDDVVLDLSDLSFNVTQVADKTGTATHGRVYLGMMNRERALVFKNGLKIQLTSAAVRGITERARPAATLVVYDLRIDEEIELNREFRRLQLRAGLQMETEDGAVEYGPVTVTDRKGGMGDKTIGHAGALVDAVREALLQLDADVQNGRTAELWAGGGSVIDRTSLPDGVYRSYIHFREGQVDESLQFDVHHIEHVGTLEGRDYHHTQFSRRPGDKRRDMQQIWGYQHQGHAYIFLENAFYEVHTDDNGIVTLYVPGGLVNAEQLTKRVMVNSALAGGGLIGGLIGAVATRPDNLRSGAEVLQIHMQTGAIEEKTGLLPHDEAITAGTIVYNTGERQDPRILATLPDGSSVIIRPGEYVLIEGFGALAFKSALYRPGKEAETVAMDIAADPEKLAVIHLSVGRKNRVVVEYGTLPEARLAADLIQRGQIAPAR